MHVIEDSKAARKYLSRNIRKKLMGNRTRVKRTREEIMLWLDEARQRKLEWEKQIEAKWAEEDAQRKAAAESHYYDIEWT